MLAQAAVSLLPGHFHGLDLLDVFFQGFLQGGYGAIHGLLTLFQISLGLGLIFFQGGPGQVKKLLIIASSNIRRIRL